MTPNVSFTWPCVAATLSLLRTTCSYIRCWVGVNLQHTTCVSLGGRCSAFNRFMRRMMKWSLKSDSSFWRALPSFFCLSVASGSRPRRMGPS